MVRFKTDTDQTVAEGGERGSLSGAESASPVPKVGLSEGVRNCGVPPSQNCGVLPRPPAKPQVRGGRQPPTQYPESAMTWLRLGCVSLEGRSLTGESPSPSEDDKMAGTPERRRLHVSGREQTSDEVRGSHRVQSSTGWWRPKSGSFYLNFHATTPITCSNPNSQLRNPIGAHAAQ